MTTIFERVDAALATLNVPYAMDVLLGTLPDTFIVYSLVSGVSQDHADNAEIARTYRVQVSILNVSGLVGLPDVDGAMAAAGFIRGPERELPKDPDTNHYGLAKDYFYTDFSV